jgi:hypothetical protein
VLVTLPLLLPRALPAEEEAEEEEEPCSSCASMASLRPHSLKKALST